MENLTIKILSPFNLDTTQVRGIKISTILTTTSTWVAFPGKSRKVITWQMVELHVTNGVGQAYVNQVISEAGV